MTTRNGDAASTGLASEETVLPPADPDLVRDLQTFLAEHEYSAALIADGERIELPSEVHRVLKQVARAMAHGQAVTVAPVNMRLTTSQAAEMLGVSRQTLVRLLEQRQLPYEQPSRHRLLRLSDVLAYRQRRHVESRMILDEMTRQAAEDGLYGDSREDYEDALRQARRSGT